MALYTKCYRCQMACCSPFETGLITYSQTGTTTQHFTSLQGKRIIKMWTWRVRSLSQCPPPHSGQMDLNLWVVVPKSTPRFQMNWVKGFFFSLASFPPFLLPFWTFLFVFCLKPSWAGGGLLHEKCCIYPEVLQYCYFVILEDNVNMFSCVDILF